MDPVLNSYTSHMDFVSYSFIELSFLSLFSLSFQVVSIVHIGCNSVFVFLFLCSVEIYYFSGYLFFFFFFFLSCR